VPGLPALPVAADASRLADPLELHVHPLAGHGPPGVVAEHRVVPVHIVLAEPQLVRCLLLAQRGKRGAAGSDMPRVRLDESVLRSAGSRAPSPRLRDRRTRSTLASKSTSCQRRPVSSPGRRPQYNAQVEYARHQVDRSEPSTLMVDSSEDHLRPLACGAGGACQDCAGA